MAISEVPHISTKTNRIILYTIMIGAFFSMFDSGVVNVGLPVMATRFDVSMNTVQWVSSAYLLVMSALLPVLGTLADHYGRRRIYNAGFLTISVFTVLCGFAINFPMLIVTRVFQAVGGAMLQANGLAIVTENLPPNQRGKNIGLLATMMAIGSVAGPPIGGIAIGLWGWRTIFYLTFLVSIIGFAAAQYSIPKDKRVNSSHFHFDFIGATLLVIAIITFVYSFSNANSLGGVIL